MELAGCGSVSSPRLHLALLRFREESLALRLVELMFAESLTAGRKAVMRAWSEKYLDFVQELNAAYVERVTLEQFLAVVETETKLPSAKRLLGKLCEIHALSAIQQNLGWYLSHSGGALSASGFGLAVPERLTQLCLGFDAEAVMAVVEGFGFPEDLLAIPITGKAWKTRME